MTDIRQAAATAGPGVSHTESRSADLKNLALLVLLVSAIYLPRLTDLSIRGEESRRGRIAWEMLETGDWIVPRVQGVPRLSRPPLQYWTIAIAGSIRGEVDAIAVRAPSVLATLLTVLLIYWYARLRSTPLAALAAALAYATFGQVLQLGGLGETEAVFTLLMAGALLVWHGGLLAHWPPVLLWCSAYFLAALATLAKGPQGPAYFVGAVGAYLLLTKRWRFVFSFAHLAGIAVFLAVLGAWGVPFLRELGPDGVSFVFGSEVAKRFHDRSWSTFLTHLAVFPFEILGCLLPWSLALIPYLFPRFRMRLGAMAAPALFTALAIAVAFPTVWLPPEARSRYFMPLYPCFAILVGFAVQIAAEARPAFLTVHLQRILWSVLAALPLCALAVVGLHFAGPKFALAQPVGTALLLGSLAMMSAAVLWRHRQLTEDWSQSLRFGTLGIAGLMATAYMGIAIPVLVAKSENAEAAVARLKETLPDDATLTSFGIVNHLFSYHYAETIPLHAWPEEADDVEESVEYFCFDISSARETRSLPFPWEEVAVISCDRNHRADPREKVVIGRRLRSTDVAQRDEERSPR